MDRKHFVLPVLLSFSVLTNGVAPVWGQAADTTVITADMHHLRSLDVREWSEFPEQAEGASLQLEFAGEPNAKEMTLLVRQQDVKQNWRVKLNGREVGALVIDENDMVLAFAIPPDTVQAQNTLTIAAGGTPRSSDDIRVGQIALLNRSRDAHLQQATLRVELVDQDTDQLTPGRLTIVDDQGAMVSVGAASQGELAIRPGIVYTSTGRATIPLPAGRYRVYGGRGFEYSLDQQQVQLKRGQQADVRLSIRRVVDTRGWVACDPHVHTRTHSGHGDATVQERMITLAGECIELPIATDHNVHVDHRPFAREMQVQSYFTPVIGNEVTTRTGHFNIFPVASGAAIPAYQSDVWRETLDHIFATPEVQVAILNHARDVHGGTTPFGPRHFNEAAGEMLDDWHVGFNGMEIINSGATQTDAFQLFHDWLALTNRGRRVTPVGSSDSHDVGRHFVGQGRTYLRCDDRSPGKVDVGSAVRAFREGRVVVSYGLFVEMQVGEGQVGDVVAVSDKLPPVEFVVRGPGWNKVNRVRVYGNGQLLLDVTEDQLGERGELPPGVLFRARRALPTLRNDTALVVLASGPGIEGVYWKTAKAYQPDSPEWRARTLSCTGPIFLDVDGDGQWTSPHQNAQKIVADAQGEVAAVYTALPAYDAAVATQAALVLHQNGVNPLELIGGVGFARLGQATRAGILAYVNAWRKNEQARGAGK